MIVIGILLQFYFLIFNFYNIFFKVSFLSSIWNKNQIQFDSEITVRKSLNVQNSTSWFLELLPIMI